MFIFSILNSVDRWRQVVIAAILLTLEYIVRLWVSLILRFFPVSIFLAYVFIISMVAMLQGVGMTDEATEFPPGVPGTDYKFRVLGFIWPTNPAVETDQDCDSSTPEIARSKGYPCEEHYCTTPDGWILGLHRIPHGQIRSDPNVKKPVVFIMHGFLQSSESWIIRHSPAHSLPLILADQGFDVWLGNNRGNTYSHKHRKYRPDQDVYWDFSIDDFIAYDIPTSIDYVLKYTKQDKLSYIGFSQGTAQGFGCFSSSPEMSEKINLFIALAPTTTVRGFNHRIVNAMINLRPEIVYLIFGRKSFLSSTLFWRRVLTRNLFKKLMDSSNSFLFGWTANNMLESEKSVLYNHIYSYTSVKVVAHWFQIQQAGKFQMYDDAQHTRSASYKPYKTPGYHLSHMKCPVALFYGGADTLPNFTSLLNELEPVYVRKEAELEHLCFMWGKDAHTTIFPDVVRLLREYEPLSKSRPSNAPVFDLTRKDSTREFLRVTHPDGWTTSSYKRTKSEKDLQNSHDDLEQAIVGSTADPIPIANGSHQHNDI